MELYICVCVYVYTITLINSFNNYVNGKSIPESNACCEMLGNILSDSLIGLYMMPIELKYISRLEIS